MFANILAAIEIAKDAEAVGQYLFLLISTALTEGRDMTEAELAGVKSRADESDERADSLDK